MKNLNAIHTEYKSIVDQKIFSILSEQHPQELYESMRYAIEAGGKRLRPVMTLVISEAVGGKAENTLPVAAAIEIVHNFTLVHDDIMDKDELRRGRETVYKKWNESIAILSGDALLVKAYTLLAELPADLYAKVMNLFSQGILEVCEGQILDMSFESREAVSLDEYFEMIDKKTAALFALSCRLGALCGGADDSTVEAMYKFGMALGRAFQIQDDLLDLMAGQAILGKDVGSDLQSGKKTFLVLHVRENASPEQLQRLAALMYKKLNDSELEGARTVLHETGTLKAANEQITTAIATAKNSLATLPDTLHKEVLHQFVLSIENRKF